MPFKDPKRRRQYDAARKRLQRAGAVNPSPTLLPSNFRLKTARDVAKLVEEAAGLIRGDVDARAIERGRALCLVAGTALRIIEGAALEERVERLEKLLRLRDEQAG